MGTQTLMDACRKYGIKRYHQVSTDEVYGDLPLDRPDLFFTEETPIHTSSPYSASKASADLLVLAYARTFHLPVSITRCSNNYGPYHFPEKLIPLMISRALADEQSAGLRHGRERARLAVCGGSLHRYRSGHAQGPRGRSLQRGRPQRAHESRGGQDHSASELGKPESLITYVKDRPGHDRRYAIDPTKIHNELGWLPATPFDEGIKKTIRWYLDNEKWWKDILAGDYQNYYEKMYGNRGQAE